LIVKFTILTLFPQLLEAWTNEAIIGKARAKDLIAVELRDIRDVTTDKHRTVDDTPYGGGAGMVMRVDVVAKALEDISADEVILLSPAGERFDQPLAEKLAQKQHIVILCGRYEGFDARVETLVTREVSIGDFVMMGGEAAAACMLEAISRLIPGVLGDEDSHKSDSFSSGLLDYPEFTRPLEWNGLPVPEILRGGNHAAIARWRRLEALRRTLTRRPDLIPAGLRPDDGALLLELGFDEAQLELWGVAVPKKKRAKSKEQRAQG
jgi:tRNA (guanine37-N1)-methyltransferase